MDELAPYRKKRKITKQRCKQNEPIVIDKWRPEFIERVVCIV